MNYTDDQLRALLAKMLPETVVWTGYILCENGGEDIMGYGRKIRDTELLHIVSLVEAESGLNSYPLRELYLYRLMDIVKEDGRDTLVIFATWQQRTRALAQVKGVTL